MALASIDSLNLISTIENVPHNFIAQIYAAIGDEDEMYKYLENALLENETIRFYLPEYIPYHDDPRFQEIRSKYWTPKDRNDQ